MSQSLPAASSLPRTPALRRRFWTISAYLTRTLVEIWWWEILLPRRLRIGFLLPNPQARRQRWALEFRDFALTMGGVWIKLGQFFSSRADVLPPDITGILADLQDEVMAVPYPAIERQIVRELGDAPETIFADFDREPRASASLGQVHFATLLDGRPVAVKVQRPGIRGVVDIDLDALRWVLNWLNTFHFVRRRANLPALYEEFAATLRLELDYIAEARNIEQFLENFDSKARIDAPRPILGFSTVRVLTLERVVGIKINEYRRLELAGVSRPEVARRLFQSYLKQVFDDGFFHADPHPGNLFVRPRGEAGRAPSGRRPFDLVFLDFGMVGHINDRDRGLMRRMVIATVQRDYAELIRLAKELGFLLPEADNRALQVALETVFERFYGLSMVELSRVDYGEIETLSRQFRDLIYDFPFQIPQDFIFLGRTLSILAGLATGIDPEFSPVEGLEPFARRIIGAEFPGLVAEGAREASELFALLLALPRRMDRLLRRVEDGDLLIEAMAPMIEGLAGVEGSINRMTDTFWIFSLGGAFYLSREEEPLLARGLLAGLLIVLWRRLRSR